MSDEPVVVTFKELKKKRPRLSENLRSTYEEGLAQIKSRKRPSDPRFDPRVHGVCNLTDWEFLEDDRKATRTKLQKMLENKRLDDETRAKVKQALHLLRQRDASYKDRKFRKQMMQKLQSKQVENLESGKPVKFMKRAELREQIRQERLKKMTRKQREKYLSRQHEKRPHSTTLLDE
ncbi:hypothetical protein X801_04913 [Opisthorchis viverrini]|uniref:Uncharacterized protein n=2 Tax=Opisthorchis viverrini TaxID=6198 RepID=A0A1S8WXT7_OPIVI|nr:hypothetical protein T265_07018 [Opisthorchis viverrini]KER25559.1 hypothetical protein T265_07018 [Opisthorchis viverrini]OON19221.1 hypothetical protein X801_04913 [Opisthorchis viverrini]